MSRATVPRTRSTASVRIFATRRGGVAGEVRAGDCLRPPQAQTYSDEEEGDTTSSIEEATKVRRRVSPDGVGGSPHGSAGRRKTPASPLGASSRDFGEIRDLQQKKRTSSDVRFGGDEGTRKERRSATEQREAAI